MKRSMTLAEIAELVGGKVRGDASRTVTGVAPIDSAKAGEVTWVGHVRYKQRLESSRAGAVLVDCDFGPTPMPAILCEETDHAVATVLGAFAAPLPGPAVGVHQSACIAASARLGNNVAVGPGVVIEDDAQIGDGSVLCAGVFVAPGSRVGTGCRLWNNVVVRERCRIGDRVTIHPNTVIGADGFGYYLREGRHHKVPHLGGVVIGDDVEIGACSCVDRAKAGDTVIGEGTKIDNLVQVAHNVTIGAGSLLCAQAGVAGSVRLGKHVVLGGQAGIRDNIVLQDGVMVGALAGVAHDVPGGARILGIPAIDARQFARENAAMRKLPDLLARVRALTKRVEELEAAADHKPDG